MADNIDYEAISDLFFTKDWTWALKDGSSITPTASDIKDAVRQMRAQLVKTESETIIMSHLVLDGKTLYVDAGNL